MKKLICGHRPIIFYFLILTFYISSAKAQTDTSQQVIPGRLNSRQQQSKPYVIMISADGFRYDYAQKYHAKHLLALGRGGVSAEYMTPSFPSITFPNHYTLVTGLYPSHHGLVSNDFYDPKTGITYGISKPLVCEAQWYGGTPLWTLAEQQHMLSANFYWVGSEAPEHGILPSYYYHYNDKIGIHERISTVVSWLKLPAEKRPHFIAFYFPEVDHEGHNFGPDAPQTERAVHFVDSAVYELTKAVKATGLKVNFVFVADHGMLKTDKEHPVKLPVIDTTAFIVSGENTTVELYAKKGHEKEIEPTYLRLLKEAKDFDVYLKSNVPAHLHYGAKDDRYNRIGDILLLPHAPRVFAIPGWTPKQGNHGFDPQQVKEMNAIFMAWGPAFKRGLKIGPFPNVDIYPMLTRILGLKYTDKIDGTPALADKMLH